MNKNFCFFGFFFLFFVLFLMGCRTSATSWDQLYQTEVDHAVDSEESTEMTNDNETSSTQEKEPEVTIWIYICGAVAQPGVYELPAGSRIVHAIEAAGGLREDADSLLINQAKVVEDGEQIRIYTKEEVDNMELSALSEEGSSDNSKVNINKAGREELMTLPGIGQAKAEDIISYREVQGAFQKIEDIMNIPGIKDAVFSKISDMITV